VTARRASAARFVLFAVVGRPLAVIAIEELAIADEGDGASGQAVRVARVEDIFGAEARRAFNGSQVEAMLEGFALDGLD